MYIVNLVKTYFLKRSTLSTLVSQELMLCKKKVRKSVDDHFSEHATREGGLQPEPRESNPTLINILIKCTGKLR